MKKTYVTSMPDHMGAFLKASKCFGELGVNITRVSYNKAVDSHTLFIDAEGEETALIKASAKLKEIGYLTNGEDHSQVVLIQFKLKDVPGSVTKVLELINQFSFNISYISSQENGSDYQLFKMGLYVNDQNALNNFLLQSKALCEVKIIDYNHTEKVFDNNIFYNSYVNGLVELSSLNQEKKEELLVNVNLAMQTLDEGGLSPFKTFDSISRFSELLAKCKGENFKPRISTHQITRNTLITLIEPDCGSNTCVIESLGERVFVDSGYACYKTEMLRLFGELFPNTYLKNEKIIVTHADVDHCGLINLFNQVICSKKTAEALSLEADFKAGFRERNPLHKPYVNICKLLTEYEPVKKTKLSPLWEDKKINYPLERIGYYTIGELEFEVYEGKGGHLSGEIILIDYKHKLVFSGDVFINMNGLTKNQAEYNKYAPILMTTVDTDVKLCAEERSALLQLLGDGEWSIFGGHGSKKQYNPC